MPFRHISTDLKRRSLFLIDEGVNQEDIAWVLEVSVRSMQCWRRNCDIYGSVCPPKNPLQGRPLMLSSHQTTELLLTVENAPEMYLDELMEWLAVYYDVALSKSALHDLLRDCGLSYKHLRKAAMERNPEVRQQFKTFIHHKISAEMLIAIDESSKDDRTIYRHYGRSPVGTRPEIRAPFVRGTRWSILPAMNVEGYMACRVVQGSINGEEFFDFIVQDVVSFSSVSLS